MAKDMKGFDMNKGALTIGFFQPEDAEGVAKLFTEVYGDDYPAKIVYHPDQLIKAFEDRDSIPIVVRTPENRVVGYSSLFRAAPDKGVTNTSDISTMVLTTSGSFPHRRTTSILYSILKSIHRYLTLQR